MKSVQIVMTFDVSDSATAEDIDFIAGNALVQVTEPTDEEGYGMPFSVKNATYTVKIVSD